MEQENHMVRKVETERMRDDRHFRIRLENLTEEDKQKLERMLLGLAWGRVTAEGRFETVPALKDVPGPIDDDAMLPFWRKPTSQELLNAATAVLTLKPGPLPDGSNGIMIESLCGYDYTPEFYREVAKRLTDYGFECLRSRRDSEGRYWEKWYLCSVACAKGALKAATEHVKDREHQMKVAISFLCRTTSFGSLCVTAQRAAMPIDD
ncbi:MAG: hypothetical protein ACM3NH_02050 [Candidatus Saccharibacteria bacterium]